MPGAQALYALPAGCCQLTPVVSSPFQPARGGVDAGTVDASKFLLGESEHTGRDDLVFFGPDGSMMSVKWHNIKIWFRYTEGFDKPILRSHMPIVLDLGSDPGESYNLFNDKMDIGWEAAVVLPVVYEYEKSFDQYPNIEPSEEFAGYPANVPPASQ